MGTCEIARRGQRILTTDSSLDPSLGPNLLVAEAPFVDLLVAVRMGVLQQDRVLSLSRNKLKIKQ